MHRVYVHEHGDVWTLASVYAQRGPLPTNPSDYVVYETERPPSVQQVCLLTEGGLRLCDIGPMHEHFEEAYDKDEGDRRRAVQSRRRVMG